MHYIQVHCASFSPNLSEEDDRIVLSTFGGLQDLLQQERVPTELVIIIDFSRQPLTVKMEIATGLIRAHMEELAESSPDAKLTTFFTQSAYQTCAWMQAWAASRTIQTSTIKHFGAVAPTFYQLPSLLPEHVEYLNPFSTLEMAIARFELVVAQKAKTELQKFIRYMEGGSWGPVPVSKPPVMLCVIQEDLFTNFFNSYLEDDEHHKRLGVLKINYRMKPSNWGQALNSARTSRTTEGFGWIVVLDPSIGILPPLPQITNVFVHTQITRELYNRSLARVVWSAPVEFTNAQLWEQLSLLRGSNMAALQTVDFECLAPEDGKPEMVGKSPGIPSSPAATRELMWLLFEAHRVWPKKKREQMIRDTAPDAAAYVETMRRLSWFGLMKNGETACPEMSAKIARLLEHEQLPDFKLALMLFRIDVNKEPVVTQALVEMAVLLLAAAPALLLDTQGGSTMQKNPILRNMAIKEIYQRLGKKHLHCGGNIGKGTLFREWVALQLAYEDPRLPDVDENQNQQVMLSLAAGLEIDLTVAKTMQRYSADVCEALGVQPRPDGIIIQLTEEQILQIETHLACAYVFDLAIVTGTEPSSGRPVGYALATGEGLAFSIDSRFPPPTTHPITGSGRFAIVFNPHSYDLDHVHQVRHKLDVSTRAVLAAVQRLAEGNAFARDGEAPEETLKRMVTYNLPANLGD